MKGEKRVKEEKLRDNFMASLSISIKNLLKHVSKGKIKRITEIFIKNRHLAYLNICHMYE